MEQRLDATYLRDGPLERAAAVALGAAGIGLGIFLVTWGMSFFWRYTPPQIAVRVANPEVRVVQDVPLSVKQDRPFVLAPPEALKIKPGQSVLRTGQQPALQANGRFGSDGRTPSGEVIQREVTVFSRVPHDSGAVVTRWNYKDGSGGVPVKQFCYYTSRNQDQSSRKVDLAFDGVRQSQIGSDLVPDVEEALSKCQWWQS